MAQNDKMNMTALVRSMLVHGRSPEDVGQAFNIEHRSTVWRRLRSTDEVVNFGGDEDSAVAFTKVPTVGSLVIGADEVVFDTSESILAKSAYSTIKRLLKFGGDKLPLAERWTLSAESVSSGLAVAFQYSEEHKQVICMDPEALLTARASLREMRDELLSKLTAPMFRVDKELVRLLLELNLAGSYFLEEAAEGIPGIRSRAHRRYLRIIRAISKAYPSIKKQALRSNDISLGNLAADPILVARLIMCVAVQGLSELYAASGQGDRVPRMIKMKGAPVFPTHSEQKLLLVLAYRAAWPHTKTVFENLLNAKDAKVVRLKTHKRG
jgi:hypothetical protein